MTSLNEVNIGIVGAGSFTELWYLPILKKHPNVCIKAIASQSGKTAENLAKSYGVPTSYDSYVEMLEKEQLDGVCIVTPNKHHHVITIEAIKRHIHVLCEKPLAVNSKEALAMLKLAQKSSIIHGVNFTYRENPAVKQMKRLIEEGICGEILEGQFQYKAGYGLSGPPGWRGKKSIGSIGGVLADLGSHLIDLAQFILGDKVNLVHAADLFFLKDKKLKTIREMENGDQVADSTHFTTTFSSGVRGSFFTSWVSTQGNQNQVIEITLFGSQGTIQLNSSELGIVLKYAGYGEPWKDVELQEAFKWESTSEPSELKFRPWRLTPKNEVWKWIDLIVSRKNGHSSHLSSIPNFQDGYHVQKVIDAVIKSAYSEKKVFI
jgi:predicted dehydrogenase